MTNCIVIPIYKEDLILTEEVSLIQCFKVLNRHPIFFIAPEGLNTSKYRELLNCEITVMYFEKKYFEGITGYNNLMISKDLYQRFSFAKYILIYQLDCYVFRDELDYWCKQNYDYIGSPWINTSYYNLDILRKIYYLLKKAIKSRIYSKRMDDKIILTNNVGNGGFSLRKTDKFLSVLNNTQDEMIAQFTISNDTKSLYNEDVFWSLVAKNIKKPNLKTACSFSLDLGVDIGIKYNKGKLPFGCHAWNKKYHYWEKYIPCAVNQNI